MEPPRDPLLQEQIEQFRQRMEAQSEAYQSAAALLAALGLMKDMRAMYEPDNPNGPSAAEHLGHRLRKWLHLSVPSSAEHSSGRTGDIIEGVILSRSGPAASDDGGYPPIVIITAGTADNDDVPREAR